MSVTFASRTCPLATKRSRSSTTATCHNCWVRPGACRRRLREEGAFAGRPQEVGVVVDADDVTSVA